MVVVYNANSRILDNFLVTVWEHSSDYKKENDSKKVQYKLKL